MEKPIFELIDGNGIHIKIYGNGKTEGFDGAVINRLPEAVANILEASAEAMEMYAREIRNIKVTI